MPELQTRIAAASALFLFALAMSPQPMPAQAQVPDPETLCTPPVSVNVGSESIQILPATCPFNGGVNGVPQGAVMAFDLAVCPAGWALFAAAADRNIIGVGTHTLGETGGAATHTLTVAEMPAHSHSVYQHAGYTSPTATETGAHGGDATTMVNPGVTSTTGGGAAHNVLDPYVALLYCKKL